MPDVRHEPDHDRFAADVSGGTAELAYVRKGEAVAFVHTFVPEPARGQDVGTALVDAAMAWARDEALAVVPQCPFVGAYVESHPDVRDLVQR